MERKISLQQQQQQKEHFPKRDRSASHFVSHTSEIQTIPENGLQNVQSGSGSSNIAFSENQINKQKKNLKNRRQSLPTTLKKSGENRPRSKSRVKNFFGSLVKSSNENWEDIFISRVSLFTFFSYHFYLHVFNFFFFYRISFRKTYSSIIFCFEEP